MSSTAALTQTTGKRYALARYDNGRRVLVLQRTDETTLQLTDVPLTAGARPFLVEQFNLENFANPEAAVEELSAIAEVYVEHAAKLGRCPLAASWIGEAA